MKIRIKGAAAWASAAVLCFTALSASAADYEFDTITGFEMKNYTSPIEATNITGVPRNSTTPTTLYLDYSLSSGSEVFDRCYPMLLTMMEKPGRYYLTISTNVAAPLVLSRCGLHLRT